MASRSCRAFFCDAAAALAPSSWTELQLDVRCFVVPPFRATR